MRKLFTATAVLAILATAPAYAQNTSNSDSGAVSGSASTANNGGNSNTSTVTGATSNSSSSATTNSTSGANAQGGASQAQTGAATAGNNQGVQINTTSPDHLKTVPQVFAPALTTTLTETCMGSTTAGGAGMGIGITLGTTWRDDECVRRLNARELGQLLGDREAARAVLCGSKSVREAYESVGRPCPQSANYRADLATSYLPQPMSANPPVVSLPPNEAGRPIPDQQPLGSKGTMQPIPNPTAGERG